MLVTLASLLHDIGKFYQRTGLKVDLSQYLKYLVRKHNTYQYWHASYTALFIKKYLNGSQELIDLSASHHLDNNSIVRKADIIAAAHDRQDSEYDNDLDTNHITSRLYSIFNEINRVNLSQIPLVSQEEF